jgi:hypothetical protein
MGRVRRRTSTKQRLMMLVVRSFLHRCRGKLKNDSNSYLLQNISHLVHPTPLMRRPRIDGLDRGRRPGTAVGDDQQQVLAL